MISPVAYWILGIVVIGTVSIFFASTVLLINGWPVICVTAMRCVLFFTLSAVLVIIVVDSNWCCFGWVACGFAIIVIVSAGWCCLCFLVALCSIMPIVISIAECSISIAMSFVWAISSAAVTARLPYAHQ